MSQAGLSKAFWAEALSYPIYLVNCLLVSGNGGKNSLEVWSGAPIRDYDNLHVFGCPAYYHVTDSNLDPRAKKKVKFMGFSKGMEGYRLWCPETSKIINSRDVTFNESRMSLQKIENNDEALKQVEKVVFSPYVIAPTKEPIEQVDNNSDVLDQVEQSLVNERVE